MVAAAMGVSAGRLLAAVAEVVSAVEAAVATATAAPAMMVVALRARTKPAAHKRKEAFRR